jgi:ankyrin repeat protein
MNRVLASITTIAVVFVLNGCRASNRNTKNETVVGPSNSNQMKAKLEADLTTAAASGNLPRVEALLAAKAPVNATRNFGYHETALMLASENGHPEVVRALLAAQADVNLRDSSGCNTALLSAYKDAGVVKLLLNVGADKRALCGNTVLNLAASTGHADVVKVLLDAGEDKNAIEYRDSGGLNALMKAADGDYVDVVKLLLDAGANKEARDNWGSLHRLRRSYQPLHPADPCGSTRSRRCREAVVGRGRQQEGAGPLWTHGVRGSTI